MYDEKSEKMAREMYEVRGDLKAMTAKVNALNNAWNMFIQDTMLSWKANTQSTRK